jgi:hypothetical protein
MDKVTTEYVGAASLVSCLIFCLILSIVVWNPDFSLCPPSFFSDLLSADAASLTSGGPALVSVAGVLASVADATGTGAGEELSDELPVDFEASGGVVGGAVVTVPDVGEAGMALVGGAAAWLVESAGTGAENRKEANKMIEIKAR